MRTEWSWYGNYKQNNRLRWIFRISLKSWLIGFEYFKNYMVSAREYRIQILCFSFCFRRYWEYKYHV